ncbi:MAG TPA: hypothetical protein VG871_03970 [Vicinamibacterales bacterium]|nr:hypothetical protein [Vicinamibacterales bacterium]
MSHKHTPEQERRIRDAALDETIEDTFPASDALSSDPNPEDEDALARREEAGHVPPPPADPNS